MALSNSTFIFFWWIAFRQLGGRIAGYSFQDELFIWAVTSAAFGLSGVLFANVSNITKLIVTGELDAFLLQPCSVLINVLCAGQISRRTATSLTALSDGARVRREFVRLALVLHRGADRVFSVYGHCDDGTHIELLLG
jgi:hypothetical protein